jgi:hypothetical protein
MTGDEFRVKLAQIEARANMAYGACVNRRTANGGRYWALGAIIAVMATERQRQSIKHWMDQAIHDLEEEFYSQEL